MSIAGTSSIRRLRLSAELPAVVGKVNPVSAGRGSPVRGSLRSRDYRWCRSHSCIAARSDTSTPGGSPPATVIQQFAGTFARRREEACASSARRPRSIRARSGWRSSAARFFAAMNSSSGISTVIFIVECIFLHLWHVNVGRLARKGLPGPWRTSASITAVPFCAGPGSRPRAVSVRRPCHAGMAITMGLGRWAADPLLRR